jgi:hypothetical protein
MRRFGAITARREVQGDEGRGDFDLVVDEHEAVQKSVSGRSNCCTYMLNKLGWNLIACLAPFRFLLRISSSVSPVATPSFSSRAPFRAL